MPACPWICARSGPRWPPGVEEQEGSPLLFAPRLRDDLYSLLCLQRRVALYREDTLLPESLKDLGGTDLSCPRVGR